MGQYHKIYNVDKKQMLHGHNMNSGLKLMEQVGYNISPSSALFLLLANSNGRGGGDANKHPLIGSWAGDRIVIQGDYAEPNDAGFLTDEQRDEMEDISSAALSMLLMAGFEEV